MVASLPPQVPVPCRGQRSEFRGHKEKERRNMEEGEEKEEDEESGRKTGSTVMYRECFSHLSLRSSLGSNPRDLRWEA